MKQFVCEGCGGSFWYLRTKRTIDLTDLAPEQESRSALFHSEACLKAFGDRLADAANRRDVERLEAS